MSRGSWVEELKELLGRAKEAGGAEKSCSMMWFPHTNVSSIARQPEIQ
jgi:hypothetical protein